MELNTSIYINLETEFTYIDSKVITIYISIKKININLKTIIEYYKVERHRNNRERKI